MITVAQIRKQTYKRRGTSEESEKEWYKIAQSNKGMTIVTIMASNRKNMEVEGPEGAQ